jgi:hypothetical protein
MILDSIIQIVSILLAFTLLGTLIATSAYYARYKISNKKAPAKPAMGATSANWEISQLATLEPSINHKKRLHFRQTSIREHVS